MAEAIDPSIACVVFDVYDTIANHGQIVAGDLTANGLGMGDYVKSMGHIAALADIGHPDWPYEAYQRKYNALLGADCDDTTWDLPSRLTPIEPVHALIQALNAQGVPVSLLTNAGTGALRQTILGGAVPLVDYVAVTESCKYGFAKPDPTFFAIAHGIVSGRLSGLKKPDQVLFVDDQKKNVQAAQDLGWRAVLFDPTNPHSSVAQIAEYFPQLQLVA